MQRSTIDPDIWRRLQNRAADAGCSVDSLLNKLLDESIAIEGAAGEPALFNRRILDASPSSLLITDARLPDHPIIYASDAFERTTGYSREDVIGRNCRFLQGDDRDQPELDRVRQAIRDGKSCRVILRNYRRDGTLFWNELYISPVFDADGNLTHFIGIQNDITGRKRVESDLREAEERYRTVADFNTDCTYWQKPDGSMHYVSPACEQIIGYTPHEIRQNPGLIRERILESDRHIWDAHRHPSSQDDSTRQIQFRVRHKDGSVRWIQHTCRPIFRADGVFDGYRVNNVDITQQKETEHLLREQERTLKLALQAAQAGVWVWDVASDRVTWDTTMEAIYGLEPGTFDGSNDTWASHVHPDDVERVMAEVGKVLADRGEFQQAYRIVRADGSVRHVLAQAVVIRDANNAVLRVIGVNRDITGRKQMEKDLQVSEERYRLLSDLTFEGIALHDNGIIIDLNPALVTMFGYSREELIGRQVIDLLFTTESQETIRAKLRENHAEPYEVTGVRKDGTRFPIQIQARQIRSDLRVASLRDITEQKQTGQQLIDNERFISGILSAVPSFVYIYDFVEDRNVFANDGLTMILGYTPEELQAMGSNAISTLIHPDDLEMVMAGIDWVQNTDDSQAAYKTFYRLRHKNGNWRHIQDQGIIFRYDEDGSVRQILGAVIDITEQVDAEKALRQSEEQYRQLVEHSQQGMVIAQQNPVRLVFASHPMTDITGYTPAELTGMGPADLQGLIHPEDRALFFRNFASRLAGEDVPARSRYRLIHKDGSMRHVDIYSILIDYDGEPASQTLFLDVTDQVEVERLQVRFQKEQEQNALIQRIISMLSHDMRSALAVISSSRDMLDRYFENLTQDRRQEKLDTIGRQIQFALNLLDDTVHMARGNVSDREFNPVSINLAMLCQVSLDEIAATDDVSQHLTFVNTGNVTTASVDEILVSRILLNLLGNAIKYSPDDSVIQLELDCNPDHNSVILRVIDEGVGIDDADLPYIFEPFYRAKNHDEVHGTGLGLSIVRDCVTRHQGSVDVQSTPGGGSVFTVELPTDSDCC